MKQPVAFVIDDNTLNLETLSLLLQKEGIKPVALHSPNELESVMERAGLPDLIFLDLEFPNHDGFQIHHMLKADPRLQSVPVVAYTVHVSEQNEARAAGFHSFIGKPLNVSRFPEQVRRILNGEPVWDTGQ